jgi:uncharacterized coiled-coil protein SlyX
VKGFWFTLLKSSALAVCALMMFVGHPPMGAQTTVQETQITELNGHLAHTDGIVDADEKRLRDIELQMSEMQGEARAAFLIIGLLSGGSIVLQIRVKKKDA